MSDAIVETATDKGLALTLESLSHSIDSLIHRSPTAKSVDKLPRLHLLYSQFPHTKALS